MRASRQLLPLARRCDPTACAPSRSPRGGRAVARALIAAACASAAACTSGAPPGFAGASGTQWTFPLVGPLEGSLLVTPVMVGAQGPYLMSIDPDAPMSIVDYELARTLKLRPFAGPPRLDESDTQRTSAYAELIGLEVGTLLVEQRSVLLVPTGTFDFAGRRIHGVLGRDVIADSLVFGFDRERGQAYLVTQRAFQPPSGSVPIAFQELPSQITNAQVRPPPRRLLAAQVGSQAAVLHLDLGAVLSQLRAPLWDRAGLAAQPLQGAVVDEVGSRRVVSQRSAPTAVAIGSLRGQAAFVPYDDQRWEERDLAGTLGLGFFVDHSVWVSWDARALHAVPRAPRPVAARIARWESPVLQKCARTGCIEVRVVDPLGGQPPPAGKPHPGLVLSITREEMAGGMALEAVLAADSAPELPYLLVNLPPNVDRLIYQVKPAFLGKSLAVVDASPFPRRCPGGGGCVDLVAR